MIYGWVGGILEVSLFMLIFGNIISFNDELQKIDPMVSYWLGFTVLTGFWEIVYLSNRRSINNYAKELISSNTSVWTNEYPLSITKVTPFIVKDDSATFVAITIFLLNGLFGLLEG